LGFPTVYHPLSQSPEFATRTQYLVVRSGRDPEGALGLVREVIRNLDPGQAIARAYTMEEIQRSSLARPRFIMALFAVFASVALILGAVGIYGVMSHAVALRANEIGIRRALGAGEAMVMGMVLREGLVLTVLGLALGLGTAAAVTKVLTGFLHEVSPVDPATFVVVAGVMASVALLAVLIPARRASGVDPLEALRVE
jgi:ABC-type antimicrobial peptide transport system permease subunit